MIEREEKSMEIIIKTYNDEQEILEKHFTSKEEADNYEFILAFVKANYERFDNGEKVN